MRAEAVSRLTDHAPRITDHASRITHQERETTMQFDRLMQQLNFIVEIDKLKEIIRRSYITSAQRRENSAEHSWHLAMMAIVLAEHANQAVELLPEICIFGLPSNPCLIASNRADNAIRVSTTSAIWIRVNFVLCSKKKKKKKIPLYDDR